MALPDPPPRSHAYTTVKSAFDDAVRASIDYELIPIAAKPRRVRNIISGQDEIVRDPNESRKWLAYDDADSKYKSFKQLLSYYWDQLTDEERQEFGEQTS